MGKVPEKLQALEKEAVARYGAEGEPQTSPSLPGAPSPVRVSVRLRSWSHSCWGTGPACLVVDPSTSRKDLQETEMARVRVSKAVLPGPNTPRSCGCIMWAKVVWLPPPVFFVLLFMFKNSFE